jgi:hypothetical protein
MEHDQSIGRRIGSETSLSVAENIDQGLNDGYKDISDERLSLMPLMGTSMPLMFLSAWHQQLGLFTPCFLA